MGKTVVYKHASRQWKDLCFVLKTTERRRENQAVIVALELCPVIMALGVFMLLSETLVGY
jgi:hypothetical protein